MPRAGRIAASDPNRIVDTAEAKAKLLELVAHMQIRDGLKIIGRSESAYEQWRKNDPVFKREMDAVTARKANGDTRRSVPDFATFSREFLHQPLYWHHQQWIDVLEGREPRDLHPAEIYEPGDPQFLLVNTPPNHGKSTVITMNWVTWRIVQDPNIRVIVISKSQSMAKDFLYGIKARLSSPRYRALQIAFGPAEGFEATAHQWSADQIYLGAKDDGEKDPTVQALGLGGQIYGARADLIIVDDGVVLSNANEADKQLKWLTQEVMTRLNPNGTFLVVGTRVQPNDLYKLIRDTFEGEWTYFAQPAVLEDTGDEDTTVTLWPRSTMPCGCKQICKGNTEPDEHGEFPRWDGPHLARQRRRVLGGSWALTYMQADVAENSIFPEMAVLAALNKQRFPGTMTAGYPGHREGGMDGLHVLCSMDPALSGTCAAIAMGVDTKTGKRWVLDLHNEAGMTPRTIHELIKRWTEKYSPREWRIEKNAMQGMLTQDEQLKSFLAARGCSLREHFTGCVQEDVEILTRDGWKEHADLTIGEMVLTHEGWSPLLGVNVFDAPEKMFRAKTHGLDCDFTENHRHLVEWFGNSSKELRFVTTNELQSNTPLVVEPPVTDGPGIGGVDLAAILAWYVCEGQDKGAGVNIAQSPKANPSKWAEIKAHLDALGWKYSIYHQETADRFHIWAPDAKILRALAPGKNLSAETVADMTGPERDAFVRAMILGDGHGREFGNTNPSLTQAFEMACLLSGSTTRTVEDHRVTNFHANKLMRRTRRKAQHKTWLRTSGRDFLTPVEPEYDKVWCPTTGPGSWVARSRGHSFLTGNSTKWDADYGVAGMAPLFLPALESPPMPVLIDIPANTAQGGNNAAAINALVSQLVAWRPKPPDTVSRRSKPGTTDLVMALWFADVRARELVLSSRAGATHSHSPFATRGMRNAQRVVNLNDILEARQRVAAS